MNNMSTTTLTLPSTTIPSQITKMICTRMLNADDSPSWSKFSAQERLECCGRLRDSRCASRFAWEVTGVLQQDWNGRVKRVVDKLVEANYPRIFKKGGVHAPHAFGLYLLASTENIEIAQPFIVIGSNDRASAGRAKKLIKAHPMFIELKTGFDIVVDKQQITFCAGTSETTRDMARLSRSLCGALVTVAPTPSCSPQRNATITCVMNDGDSVYIALPAHVFSPVGPENDIDDGDDDCDSQSSSAEDSSVDSDSQSHVDGSEIWLTNASSGPHELRAAKLPLKHVICLAEGDISSAKLAEHVQQENDPRSHDLVTLGYLDCRSPSATQELAYVFDREKDFVLIKIDPNQFRCDNTVVWNSEELTVDLHKAESVQPSDHVLITCGTSGTHSARLSKTQSTMLFPWSKWPQTVLELFFTLAPGDSGSLVLTREGAPVGVAVATVPEHGVTYVVPISDWWDSAGHLTRRRELKLGLIGVASSTQSDPPNDSFASVSLREQSKSPFRRSHNHNQPVPAPEATLNWSLQRCFALFGRSKSRYPPSWGKKRWYEIQDPTLTMQRRLAPYTENSLASQWRFMLPDLRIHVQSLSAVLASVMSQGSAWGIASIDIDTVPSHIQGDRCIQYLMVLVNRGQHVALPSINDQADEARVDPFAGASTKYIIGEVESDTFRLSDLSMDDIIPLDSLHNVQPLLRDDLQSKSAEIETIVPVEGYPGSWFVHTQDHALTRADTHSSSQSALPGNEESEKYRCPYPECGKVFKDLKAHMLTHQAYRPGRCPFVTCEYHLKGFARKYDRNRHILTHYKGTMVCGFCSGSGTSAEKSFNRADVFKRHLATMHGVKQNPSNSRKQDLTTSSIQSFGYSHNAAAECSSCAVSFNTAQEFYEHLDDCILRVLQQE